MNEVSVARAQRSFLQACELDVAVRKPGNVSVASPGHGMHAQLFRASAQAACAHLFAAGTSVGQRVEGAMAATLAVAGCNTNLGILLLCAPLALAVEREPSADDAPALRQAVGDVLARLDVRDAEAVYRAIVMANPGGLGSAPQQDVHEAPSLGLRQAMTLAAERDMIARQYRDGYADLFELGLPALAHAGSAASDKPSACAVQRVFLTWLARHADSHIVRKQGPAVAQSVMKLAQVWLERLPATSTAHEGLDGNADFRAWDESLKASRINPGTSADLTVATLMLAGLTRQSGVA